MQLGAVFGDDRLMQRGGTRSLRTLLTLAGLALTFLLFISDGSPAFATTYTVDTTSDANLTACTGAADDCSLRGAINNAVANAGADTITFDSAGLDDSIEALDAGGDTGLYTSLALDASGNPVIAYKEVTLQDLKVIHCNDPRCTGGDESIASPDTSGNVGNYISLALDASGNPVVAYEDFTAGDLNILHCGNANCTAGNSITAPDPTAAGHGRYNSLVLDASGNPVVSYWDVTNSDLKVMHCNDPNCSGGNESITSPDTGGEVGQFTSIALDTSGFPVVSYYDVTNGNLKVLHCGNADCTAGNSVGFADTVGDVGTHTSLVLDGSGLPAIAYRDNDNGALKVKRCANPACGSGHIRTPVIGSAGAYNSLALDANDYPVVSYYDGSPNLDLTIMHCNDLRCDGGNESFASPDKAGNVGQYTSLVLDADDNPVVSYYDASPNFNLKLLHCGGANCDGTATIGLGSALPDLSNNGDTVDGAGVAVEVAGMGTGFDCFTVSGDNNTVVGLAMIRDCFAGVAVTGASNTIGGSIPGARNVISGNARGVLISGASATGNIVAGNYIGTNSAGTERHPKPNQTGVYITEASNNTIGGDTAGERNVISGSTVEGVWIRTESATGNTVSGNYIGTNASGDGAIANMVGVAITSATGNTIGGGAAGEGNVISGNTADGVQMSGVAANNVVSGNYIGTNASGTAAIPNTDGVRLFADGNTIGGDVAGERNVISGNSGRGVYINFADSNTVSGNYIGTDAAGTGAIGNGLGIWVSGNSATSNTIGGSTAGERNVISGNDGTAIQLAGVSNVVKGNYIGTDVSGAVALANNGYGIFVSGGGSGNTIGGSAAADRNVISGNSAGIAIDFMDFNVVSGNYIGTDAAGTSALPNSSAGVRIDGGENNTIGGTIAGERNVISGNGSNGVQLSNAFTTSNVVTGNYIGTNATGAGALGNTGDGVWIQTGATGNTIGGTTAGERNVISGNGDKGVELTNAGTGNVISGNYIGVNATGDTALPNASNGVLVSDTSGATIGGSLAVAGNVISGNTSDGVVITGASSNNNVVGGNLIGLNATGTSAVPNLVGVHIVGSDTNTIGGTTAAERNVISGNSFVGVIIGDGVSNAVEGNYIGTDINGATGIGNAAFGVAIADGATGNSIGGTGEGEANLIAFNGSDGVVVTSASANNNDIRGNSIHSNTGLGIDLGGDGVTENDAGDGDSGPNDLMNFPVITSASFDGTNTTVSGSLDTGTPATSAVDVFAVAAADPSGNGEGDVYLGSATPDGGGSWAMVVPGRADYAYFTATATDASGNTSEFSDVGDTDYDGDGFVNSVDNCDNDYNGLQVDNDGDGIGDVCDDAVRNRYSVDESSLVSTMTSEPGQPASIDNRAFHQWDYEPGAAINIGAIVGTFEVSRSTKVSSGACVGGPTNTISLYNASVDNTTNLFDTAGLNGDADGDGIPNGVEGYPRFLNTLLDPERRTGIDEDGDGTTDEDVADGVDNDADTLVDEDGTGTPRVPHARYYGSIAGEPINVLVFEVVANEQYEVVLSSEDTTEPPNFIICSPVELSITIQGTSSANTGATPQVPGGQAVLNTPATNKTHLFALETVDRPDADGDGVSTLVDNCPLTPNASQDDADSDAIGDACEPASGPCAGVSTVDCDGDGILNYIDSCPTVANAGQEESELRTPSPFGLAPANDHIGDACDLAPTVVDDGDPVGINRYSDGICVTGGGFADADTDGWCDADADPNDGDASLTPEDGAISPGSCRNGVDDDGDTLVDSADPACADADGDTVPDNVDVCPEAADPLQLDADSDGTGDACEAFNVAETEVVSTTNAANAELRQRLVEVAPEPLHRNDGIVLFSDPDWGITSGATVTDGAIVGSLTSNVTVAFDPVPVCNQTVTLSMTLIDASTNPADTISPGSNFGALLADVGGNGIRDGAEQYPDFLLKLRQASGQINNDGDAATDEDPIDGIDNDQDGLIDEDPFDHVPPLVRMFGAAPFQGANHVVNILVYSPGALPAFTASQGYPALVIMDDPTIPSATGNVTAFCSSQDHRIFRYGVSADNPGTGSDESGAALLTNDSAAVTEQFSFKVSRLSDLDGDGIENYLDVCAFDPDNDDDGTDDQLDATPWNPRLVSPPGDPDGDGLPTACDPDPFVPSPPGSGPDEDGDHVPNDLDNCPNTPNEDQTDSDADGIGDVCDPDPLLPEGSAQTVVNGTPVCTDGVDEDKDGYCADIDPNDSDEKQVPEASAFDPVVCQDLINNDPLEDSDVDLDDTGCGDLDVDGVLNEVDNCPATYNPDQRDSDSDTGSNVGEQPFLASGIGDPPVQGDPFLASDKFGGDVCDPDDDNDGLADGSEPPGCQFDTDCDDDGLSDLVEYTWPCLDPVNPATNGSNPDATHDFDGDGRPNLVETAIGDDPCTPTSCVDSDGDGYDDCAEQWVGTDPSDRCGIETDASPSPDWPADVASTSLSADKITLADLTSFLFPAPSKLNTHPGDTGWNKRYDIVPNGNVSLSDLTSILFGASAFPPMLGGAKAFNGPTCTDA